MCSGTWLDPSVDFDNDTAYDDCKNKCDEEPRKCNAFHLQNASSGKKQCDLFSGETGLEDGMDANFICYIVNTKSYSTGDPHSRNMFGQRFDMKRPGNYTFLRLPRGGDGQGENLDVEAHIASRGSPCSGQLYITGLRIAGSWLGTVGGKHRTLHGNGNVQLPTGGGPEG